MSLLLLFGWGSAAAGVAQEHSGAMSSLRSHNIVLRDLSAPLHARTPTPRPREHPGYGPKDRPRMP